MSTTRREFLKKSSLVTGAIGLGLKNEVYQKQQANADSDRLVLLGTQGGPFIRSYQQTPSANLIVHDKIPYVIDTGYGVSFKLREAGINLSSIQYIFITHHHSDHNLELGPLLYNSWIAGLAKPIHVYAPAGLKKMLNYYWKSNSYDINTRIKNEGRPDIRKLVINHEIKEGTLIKDSLVEISALKNIHPPVDESFAFKFKLGEKIIVFSGDTTYCPALVDFAMNADYLIHEVMDAEAVGEMVKRRPNAVKLKESILSHHTLAQDAGKIAQSAKAKNLILNHFVPPDDKSLTDQKWIDMVRPTYSGNVIVGKDMMQITL